jgi:hypothetical protein
VPKRLLKVTTQVCREVDMTTETLPRTELPRRRNRNRRLGAVAGLALVVGLLVGACTPESYRSADLINEARRQHGLHGLEFNAMLHFKAQGWADQLNRQGYLSHSNLRDGNHSTTWTKLGENVGYAWSLEQAHNAFMNSPAHRANILDRTYNKVGTGVVQGGDGRLWVVQEFMHEWFVG